MIHALFFIEAQGNHKDVVQNSLKKLSLKLKEEEGITVKDISLGDVAEEDGTFSSIMEADIEFDDFLSFIRTSIFYTPSALEMMEPDELQLTGKQFLDAIGEIIRIARTVLSKLKIHFKIPNGKKKEVGLKVEVIEELIDDGAIWAKIVLEKEGKTRKSAVDEVLKTLGEDVRVNKVKSKKVKSEKPFSGVVGMDAVVTGPVALVNLALKHMPVLLEIKEPEDITLSMLDLQDICLDLSSTFFELSYAVTHTGEVK